MSKMTVDRFAEGFRRMADDCEANGASTASFGLDKSALRLVYSALKLAEACSKAEGAVSDLEAYVAAREDFAS